MAKLITSLLCVTAVTSISQVVTQSTPDVTRLLTSSAAGARAQAAWSSDGALRERVAALGAGLTRGVEGLGGQLLEQAGALLGGSSRNCSSSLQLLGQALSTGERWAQLLLDACGKPGSGLLQGELRWLGSFQECLDVIAPGNLTTPPDQFRGQYCLLSVPLNLSSHSLMVQVGSCFPDSCNDSDVHSVVTAVFQPFLNHSMPSLTIKCQKRDLELSGGAYAAIAVLSVFGLLLLLGTAYDVVGAQVTAWRNERRERSTKEVEEQVGHGNFQVCASDTGSQRAKTEEKTRDGNSASVWARLLVSFSLYTNGKKLLDAKQSAGSLTAVHGIRFLSMTWVLLGHSLASGLELYANQLEFQQEVTSRWTFLAITNATVSVDTFFLLSGLLVSYLLVKDLKRVASPGKINWPLFYFHRYWRLTPAYMLVLLTFVELGRHLGSGPFWSQDGLDVNCYDNWWINLLYLNNLVRKEQACMGWTWYLAIDMQFYVLSPLIVVPLFLFPPVGVAVAVLFLLATATAAGVVSQVYSLLPALGVDPNGIAEASELGPYMTQYYLMPYCRMGPYVIGILTGYILQRTQCKVNISKAVNALCWALATATCLAVVYGLWPVAQGNPLSVEVAAFYNGLHRTAWGVGVAWVVFACATGHGGFVNTFLSWKGLVPLSRLTYCCYLIHLWIMEMYYQSQKTLLHTSDINIVFSFFGHLMMTYGVALVVSLAFEAPMLALEKVFIRRS